MSWQCGQSAQKRVNMSKADRLARIEVHLLETERDAFRQLCHERDLLMGEVLQNAVRLFVAQPEAIALMMHADKGRPYLWDYLDAAKAAKLAAEQARGL